METIGKYENPVIVPQDVRVAIFSLLVCAIRWEREMKSKDELMNTVSLYPVDNWVEIIEKWMGDINQ